MLDNTITIALEGNVSLDLFADGIKHFHGLVRDLSREVARDAEIDWEIEDLQSGSAIATIRGESDQAESVDRVISAYVTVGKALQSGEPIPYSDKIAKQARDLTKILNGRITSIRFETAEDEAIISGRSEKQSATLISAYGAIEGRVQTLSNRKGLRFALYDTVYDRVISCYLGEGQDDLMRDAWGHRAIVEGKVSRELITGSPVTIRHISNIIILPDTEIGNYRHARGITPIKSDDPMPEETIRRVRNA